ncbi:PilZ domain-containing protein [Methylobacterium mesophilicum SR1.6/6]|uniref:PilZ domain-containing protein n=1 Tax=Methylobacterium mesophilicum SR1.6/6 TaxID=908290 RepID=A0A6B9FMT1_9HYPH|nr:PilZ domain-containing protein [Methylobacterium mesophilicum SR1.6/6]
MVDLRRQWRVATSAMVEIVPTCGPPIPCKLADLSANGARLHVNSVLGIPDVFQIRFMTTDEILSARVVWRRPNQIGFVFAPDTALAS